MERDHRSKDDDHDRRWRRQPFTPASFRRPTRRDDHDPRDPQPEGGEGTAPESPPQSQA